MFLIVSIPDLYTLTYFSQDDMYFNHLKSKSYEKNLTMKTEINPKSDVGFTAALQ